MKSAGEAADHIISAICDAHDNNPAALIEILHDVQGQKGHVPDGDLVVIAMALNLSRAEIFGTMSFYPDFHAQPPEAPVVKICRGEACQAMGALELADKFAAAPMAGEPVEVEPVYCLGNCALAPAAMIGDTLIGRADVARLQSVLADLKK
ncbi:MAG: formate dehydrogenase [Alphaproteobacteria bacterium]|nr:formate dehydrogenase [Alphaproteobacteria bacterium]